MNIVKRTKKIEEFLLEKVGVDWRNYPKSCGFQLKVWEWKLEQDERRKNAETR